MVKHDIHIHTNMSSCGSKDAFISRYVQAAKEIGLSTIGFADHAWDENVTGVSDWYRPQTFNRLAERRGEIKKLDTEGIEILLGAEGEYAKEVLAVTENALEFVDYILVPHSHTHMKGVVLPEECENNPEKHANYLVKSFISLCGHKKRELFFGIVHPMYPIGQNIENAEIIYSYISDEMLNECALSAKEANIALEINLSTVKNIMKSDKGTENCYRRFFDTCKKIGCEFFMGSDAHGIDAFITRHSEAQSIIDFMGISEKDLTIAKLHRPNV